MGGGSWDKTRYHSDTASRARSKTPDFEYTNTATKIHENLDPLRIKDKPFGKLESRDNVDHPNSNAVLVCFDVTGSNKARAVDAQKKLPNLMDLLHKYLADPQVSVAANDDFTVEAHNSIQISDFESDNRIDEHIRNVWLVGDGGGNDGESYDLLLYAAARKTVLDCFEKRNRKGYFFMYADEPIFDEVDPAQVKNIFGDTLQAAIPIAEIIEEVRKQYHVFVIWPQSGYQHARDKYVELFGDESVLTLQHPNLICEMIGSVIGFNEGRVTVDKLEHDLISVGTDKEDASRVTAALAKMGKASGSSLKSGKAAGADRL
jgi:hypothetical protein